jgi:pyridoxal phosphate enzyme (YggS family)
LGIANNLEAVRERIKKATARAGRPPGSVTLVAVSKTFPSSAIEEAYRAGQRHFGENRVQEFDTKSQELHLEGAVFHLIGHLQSNKAARAASLFQVIHTIDSVSLAQRLQRLAERPLDVFLEVKLSEEAAKTGAAESELEKLADQVRQLDKLRLRGLMTMPPWSLDPEPSRHYFRRLREIGERLGLSEFSMGMTNDFEVAIEEGATMVRVGTAIFGKRTPPA